MPTELNLLFSTPEKVTVSLRGEYDDDQTDVLVTTLCVVTPPGRSASRNKERHHAERVNARSNAERCYEKQALDELSWLQRSAL